VRNAFSWLVSQYGEYMVSCGNVLLGVYNAPFVLERSIMMVIMKQILLEWLIIMTTVVRLDYSMWIQQHRELLFAVYKLMSIIRSGLFLKNVYNE